MGWTVCAWQAVAIDIGDKPSNMKGNHTMSTFDIIRAWKDEEYRNSLSELERAALPQHPAGEIELSDAELETVAGGLTGPSNTKVSACWPQYPICHLQ